MKKTLFSMFSALFVAGAVLSSCNPQITDLTPSAAISVEAGTTSAAVTFTTANLREYAYSVSEPGAEITDPVVLFAKGTTGSLSNGDNLVTVSGIEGNHTYAISAAFKISDNEFYSEVLTAEFTTGAYTQNLTLVNTTYDGFTVHFKRPEEVQEGNVVRYGALNLAWYNELKTSRQTTDAVILGLNDEVYGNYWTGDADLTYNDDNILKRDEKGDLVIMYDDYVTVHDKIAPGEPLVFIVGEFAKGESMWGWGEGYYQALFDDDAYYDSLFGSGGSWGPGPLSVVEETNEDSFWTGYHERIQFTAKQPELLEAKVDVEIAASAASGTIKITPDEEVFQYCYFVCDDATYEMLLGFIDNNPDYVQWFVTSVYGFRVGCQSATGAIEIALEDYAYVEPEMKYHFLITALGNEDGTVQSFQHIEFETPSKTGKAPEVVVTAVEPDQTSPFAVYFNVKCPSKNAVSGVYAANYLRDWEMTLNNKKNPKTYADILAQGFQFSDSEIAKINSDEGLTLSFASVPDEVTRFAVMLYNEEKTPNTIKGTDDPAVAEIKSDRQPDAPKVDSPLFSALLGEWTMTANVNTSKKGADGNYDFYPDGTRSCKITIVDSVTYPETLPEEVYALYAGKTKEYVDGLYEEFKSEAEIFNTWLKGQNRLLCLGFGYADNPYYLPGNGIYKDPYDLFTDKDYSSYDNRSLFWDFGPKWYLEVAADGSVSVPFNSYIMYPLSGWTISYPLYMAAYGEDGVLFSNGGETLAFPVNVASDYNTVTVNPILDSNKKAYYPSAGINYMGGFRFDNVEISSALTLTKGWTESKTAAMSAPAAKVESGAQTKVLSESAGTIPMFRKTPFKGLTDYKKVSCKVVDKEQFINNIENSRNSR